MKSYQTINDHEAGGGDHHIINSYQDGPTIKYDLNIDTNNSKSLYYPQDHLVPPFDSDERPSSLLVGAFNLIATIVGGGVLSLPVVFHKCGIVFTSLAMVLAASMTNMSLIMLCYCSRRGGGSSYGEVVRSAFGQAMEEGVSWLLCVYLILSLVAYMVLARDVWTPLARQVLGVYIREDYVLLAITIFLLPFLCQRTLHSLRKICYIGFASISVLCVALWMASLNHRFNNDVMENNGNEDDSSKGFKIEFFKIPSLPDLLFCFPIVTCSFLCHFNIIAIQNALRRPTRERMQNLIQYAIGAAFLLMWLFGLGGYIFGGNDTEGNILLNVPMSRQGTNDGEYYLFLLGRIGCGITIMIAMPLNLLPCREALLEVVDVWFHNSHHRSDEATIHREKEKCCWRLFHRYNSYETVEDAEITTEDELLFEVLSMTTAEGQEDQDECLHTSTIIRHDPIQEDYIFRNTVAHYGGTLLITASAYLGAVAVSGVAAVWSFIGSSMAFFIAFILPCGCFIVIESAVPTASEGGDRRESWIKVAWVILWFSIIGAGICTINNIVGFSR